MENEDKFGSNIVPIRDDVSIDNNVSSDERINQGFNILNNKSAYLVRELNAKKRDILQNMVDSDDDSGDLDLKEDLEVCDDLIRAFDLHGKQLRDIVDNSNESDLRRINYHFVMMLSLMQEAEVFLYGKSNVIPVLHDMDKFIGGTDDEYEIMEIDTESGDHKEALLGLFVSKLHGVFRILDRQNVKITNLFLGQQEVSEQQHGHESSPYMSVIQDIENMQYRVSELILKIAEHSKEIIVDHAFIEELSNCILDASKCILNADKIIQEKESSNS